MDDLLKEAIADAKAVRETALENAKIALEEAFTPRLQSMLAKKIQSEIEEEGEDWEDEEEAPEEEAPEEFEEDDEDPSDEFSDEEPEEDMGDEEEEMEAEGYDESDIIEINGVKYAPVVSEEEDEEAEEEAEEDEVEEADDLDLEAVLRELEEDESEEDESEEEVDESKEEEVDESKEEEVDESKEEVEESTETEEVDESKEDEVNEDEDIDLEEVIAALSEEENEEEATNEVAKLQSELDEHRNVVKYLRTKLNEVNLLNAKLLFTNKLFRSFGLTNDQKMKVVENFDRAHNLREVKLVYSTLAESFGSKPKTEIKESKGSASKAVASTKSEKQEVIAEGHEMRDRFKKLAGIL
jgi:hypothetical protein